MIHVDVAFRPSSNAYLVETSVDGAGWHKHYECPVQMGEAAIQAKTRADDIANIMIYTLRWAGHEVRGTSCGYAL